MKDLFFEWNRLGLFVLPNETASAYLARVEEVAKNCPQGEACARTLVQEKFDINPTWVQVVYSKKELYPWEAGCTWYDSVPWIQLHPACQKRKTLYGLYSHEEVLAHEYVHAVRAVLGSHKFEELFAYLVSKGPFSSFRKVFGPLFTEPRDTLIFILGVILGLIFSPLIATGIVLIFSLRLSWRWLQYSRCKKHLEPLVEKNFLLPFMVRLTDEEIILFSTLSSTQIASYINEQKQTNFRWQVLTQCYTQ